MMFKLLGGTDIDRARRETFLRAYAGLTGHELPKNAFTREGVEVYGLVDYPDLVAGVAVHRNPEVVMLEFPWTGPKADTSLRRWRFWYSAIGAALGRPDLLSYLCPYTEGSVLLLRVREDHARVEGYVRMLGAELVHEISRDRKNPESVLLLPGPWETLWNLVTWDLLRRRRAS
jgi:hypothetical protein